MNQDFRLLLEEALQSLASAGAQTLDALVTAGLSARLVRDDDLNARVAVGTR